MPPNIARLKSQIRKIVAGALVIGAAATLPTSGAAGNQIRQPARYQQAYGVSNGVKAKSVFNGTSSDTPTPHPSDWLSAVRGATVGHGSIPERIPPLGAPGSSASTSPQGLDDSQHATDVQLAITYHAQQDPDWCDPADIQMWLEAEGATMPDGDDSDIQQAFWNYELNNNDGYSVDQWDASPYAVASTLNHFGRRSDIGDAPQATLEAAGAVIARSVAGDRQPTIVMINGGSHYVLVTGVVLGPDGIDGPPAQVTIANPLAYGVGGTPPDGDTGLQTYTWDEFAAFYTPNTTHGGIWSGQWVVVAPGIDLLT